MTGRHVSVTTVTLPESMMVKYVYEKDKLLRAHDTQLIILQIQQFEDLKRLAELYNDVEMVAYYEKLASNRRDIVR